MDNKENTQNMKEKAYTLRRLNDGDLWPVLEIVGKVFPEDLSSAFMGLVSGDKTASEVGGVVMVRIVAAIMKNMRSVQDEVYTFLSDVSGLDPKEIQGMEFGTTPRMIWDIVKNEKNNGFFTEFSKLS